MLVVWLHRQCLGSFSDVELTGKFHYRQDAERKILGFPGSHGCGESFQEASIVECCSRWVVYGQAVVLGAPCPRLHGGCLEVPRMSISGFLCTGSWLSPIC